MAVDGYDYTGSGDVEDDPTVVPPPAHAHRVKVQRRHMSLPAPTLVNGRPQ